MKVLEVGEIAQHKVNKHRRIRFDYLMAYKKQQALQSSNAVDELAQQAQELGMY